MSTFANLEFIYDAACKSIESRSITLMQNEIDVQIKELFHSYEEIKNNLENSTEDLLGNNNEELNKINRWWLWSDFTIRAFRVDGPFFNAFHPDSVTISEKIRPTRYHQCHFLKSSSLFLLFLIGCANTFSDFHISRNTYLHPLSDHVASTLSDFAWLFSEYGIIEHDIPRELPVLEALECFCQEKNVYPEIWQHSIGLFFHTIDVWLLGELILRTKPGKSDVLLYGEFAELNPHWRESKAVMANYYLASIFHDIGRIGFYVSRIWESVTPLAKVLLPNGKPSFEDLMKNALEHSQDKNWGLSNNSDSSPCHGIISYYLLSNSLGSIGKTQYFKEALEAIGYHNQYDSQITYISDPISILLAIVDSVCISDNHDDDPIARQKKIITDSKSLYNMMVDKNAVECIESNIFPSKPGFAVQDLPKSSESIDIDVLMRSGQGDFCVQYNWLTAYKNWSRLDLQGCPFNIRVTFISPYEISHLKPYAFSYIEELKDYLIIQLKNEGSSWIDLSKATEYINEPTNDRLIINLSNLLEDRPLAKNMTIDWEDFVAWKSLHNYGHRA